MERTPDLVYEERCFKKWRIERFLPFLSIYSRFVYTIHSFENALAYQRSQLRSSDVCRAGVQAFFEFTSASLSKRVWLQSLSYEYLFSFMWKVELITTSKLCAWTHFEKETERNSEMVILFPVLCSTLEQASTWKRGWVIDISSVEDLATSQLAIKYPCGH